MSITTFAQLIANPATEKVKLVEITPAENIGGGAAGTWTQHGTYPNVYYRSYLYESVLLSTGETSKIPKLITAMSADGTALTSVASVAACDADNTSFYHDTTSGVLYVNMSGVAGGYTPSTVSVLMAFFTIYLATKGVTLNSVYYEPYVSSAPTIQQSSGDLLSGRTETSTGTISLFNDGFWDTLFYRWVWNNKRVVVKFGGEDLPYSEYRTCFTGVITGKSWSRLAVSFEATSIHSKLDRLIPHETFTVTDFPNVNANILGAPIPIAYGTFDERTAPIVCAVDEAYAVDQVKFKICGHEINAITGAWVLYGDGADWVQLTLDAGLSAANTYKLDSLVTATLIVRFTASGYAADTVQVKVAFSGKKNVDTTLMTTGSDIVKDIITSYGGGFTTADLDTTAFADSKTASDMSLAVYLKDSISILEVINKICVSELAYFFVDDDGLFVYKVWEPVGDTGSLDEYTEADLLDYSIEYPAENEFESVRVGHSQSMNNNNYQYTTAHAANVETEFDNTKSKLVQTYIDNESDAAILAARLALLHTPPFEIVKGIVKWQLANTSLGDRVKLNASRIPSNESGGATEIIEIVGLSKSFEQNTISFSGFDIRGFGLNVGFWMPSTAPAWSVATDAEREASGFWCDSNGYADPTDGSSKNKSLWW